MKTKSSKRVELALLVAGAVFVFGTHAQAQELGQADDWTLSAERLFGFYDADVTAEFGNDVVEDRDRSSLGFAYQESIGMFDVPRIGFDYFIIPHLSLGGSLGFFSHDPDTDDDESDEYSGFLFSPRVGYAVPFNDQWGVWPRGGLTYVERDGGVVMDQTALSAEVPFYFMPARNVGFTGSILFDIGLAGSWRAGGQERDYDEQLFGLGFGMFARF